MKNKKRIIRWVAELILCIGIYQETGFYTAVTCAFIYIIIESIMSLLEIIVKSLTILEEYLRKNGEK